MNTENITWNKYKIIFNISDNQTHLYVPANSGTVFGCSGMTSNPSIQP